MFRAEILKKLIGMREFSRLALAFLIFSCLVISSIPVSAQQKSAANLVYCPLQKAWVKGTRFNAELRLADNSLDAVCSANEHKQQFVYDLARNSFFKQIASISHTQEQLFFHYLEKGKQVFAEIASSGSAPNLRIIKAATKEKSGTANFNVDFHQHQPESFGLQTLARPPTFRQSVEFDSRFIPELKRISRNINPRSPPVFI